MTYLKNVHLRYIMRRETVKTQEEIPYTGSIPCFLRWCHRPEQRRENVSLNNVLYEQCLGLGFDHHTVAHDVLPKGSVLLPCPSNGWWLMDARSLDGTGCWIATMKRIIAGISFNKLGWFTLYKCSTRSRSSQIVAWQTQSGKMWSSRWGQSSSMGDALARL